VARVDVGYICEGFPDDVREMVGDHKMCNVGSERGAGFEGSIPVSVVMMEWALVVRRAAVVAFELGRGRL
jgi:hypothetical protein